MPPRKRKAPAARKESTPAQAAAAPPRSSETRERLLVSAIELFSKHGFAGTTTRQIARHARRNEALIFRHFPTKRDLYAAIIQRKISQQATLELLEAASVETTNDEAFFRVLAQRFFLSKCGDPQFLRLLYFSALEGHELAELFFEAYARHLRTSLQGYIQRGVAAGRFRDLDPVLVVRAFVGMVAHYQVTQELFRFNQTLPPSEEAAEVFVDIFLRGLSAPEKKKRA